MKEKAHVRAGAKKNTAPHITHHDRGLTPAQRHADHLKANGIQDGQPVGLKAASEDDIIPSTKWTTDPIAKDGVEQPEALL